MDKNVAINFACPKIRDDFNKVSVILEIELKSD